MLTRPCPDTDQMLSRASQALTNRWAAARSNGPAERQSGGRVDQERLTRSVLMCTGIGSQRSSVEDRMGLPSKAV
jgi:hypothetical protein